MLKPRYAGTHGCMTIANLSHNFTQSRYKIPNRRFRLHLFSKTLKRRFVIETNSCQIGGLIEQSSLEFINVLQEIVGAKRPKQVDPVFDRQETGRA